MLILGNKFSKKLKPQKGVIAMTGVKVANRKKRIKLVFNGGEEKGFDLEGLIEEVGLEMQALATSAGTVLMMGLIESETEYLAGKRYNRTTEVDRWGSQGGYVTAGGQKVKVKRPRLRGKQGEEVQLTSYERFQQSDERTQAVFQRMVAGLSCRNYPQAIEIVRRGYGISKSVVSREMVKATEAQLQQLCERDLTNFELCVLIIDGIKIGGSMVIVALGVDVTGKKEVMGFRQGSTENADVCVKLFEDMVERGLKKDNPVLIVIDGSKALRSAVDRLFGKETLVHRCQYHKRQNVKAHLPKNYQAEYDRKIQAAYKMKTYDDAKRALEQVIDELERINESAAESLNEGLEETLTLHRLELPEILRKSLSTTNLIESAFSQGRSVMRNVKRWRDSHQIHRWTATALVDAEKNFRRIRGYRSMPTLINSLERERNETRLDNQKKVA